MTRKYIGLAVFVVATLGLLAWLAHSIGAIGGGRGHSYTVRMVHAAGLVTNNAVKIAGVKVGVIEDITVDHDTAVLALRIERDIVLHDDARAIVRAKSLLGEKYLQLEPGNREGPVLQPGSDIPRVETPFEIDQVLNALEPILGGEDSIAASLAPLATRLDGLLASAAGEDGKPPVMTREEVEKLIDDLLATVESIRRMAEANEQALGELIQNSNRFVADPRLGRIVGNVDRSTAKIADRLPQILERTDRALASLERLGKVVDDERAAKIGTMIDDAAVASANLKQTSEDLKGLTGGLKPLMDDMSEIAKRASSIDEDVIRRFLQQEGVKIYIGTKKNAKEASGEIEPQP